MTRNWSSCAFVCAELGVTTDGKHHIEEFKTAEDLDEGKFKKPIPFFKKPFPPKIPIFKKPLPPIPIIKKPLPPPIPIFKKPLPPPIPSFEKPFPPPHPDFKKPMRNLFHFSRSLLCIPFRFSKSHSPIQFQ